MQGKTNVGGGGGFEEKTITAGTSQVVVEAAQGKAFKKVTVNPTPSQSKSATPSASKQTVTPDSGKLLSSVEIAAVQTEEKTVDAGTLSKDVTPTSGKFLNKVTVNPTPSQAKSVTPTTAVQTVRPDSDKLLSSVEVGAIKTEETSVTAGTSAKDVTPTDGKFLEKVTVKPTPSYSTSATPTPEGRVLTPSSGYFFSKVTLNPFDLAGENVWEKCYTSSTSEYLSSVLFTASPEGGNSMYFPLPTDTYPFLACLTNWVDFFDGFTIYRSGLDYTLSKVGSELHLIRNNEDKGAMTYENGVIGFPYGWGSTSDAEFSYYGEKTAQYEGKGTFIEYVVSDDTSAYPDGGNKNGYWYEKVVEGVQCEKGIITPTANTTTLTIPTNLTSVSKVIITSGTTNKTFSSFPTSAIMFLLSQKEKIMNFTKTGSYAGTKQPKTIYSKASSTGGFTSGGEDEEHFTLADGVVTITTDLSTSGNFGNFNEGYEYQYELYE